MRGGADVATAVVQVRAAPERAAVPAETKALAAPDSATRMPRNGQALF